VISRTDSIGDVVLTLPVAAIMKRLFPECRIIFLGRAYTLPLLVCCEHIDEVADWDALKNTKDGLRALEADAILHVFPRKEIALAAKRAGIPLRAGTRNRLYHWRTCNKKIRLSRRHSSLHESQLNLKLLIPFGAKRLFYIDEIPDLYGLSNIPAMNDSQRALLDNDKFNLILHPGSRGSAREWGIENFKELVTLLPETKFRIFVTGTASEGEGLQEELFNQHPAVVNLCGSFDLPELISFIANADGLVAASTGPLHLAAALGRTAIGIYPPIKPMHPGRWAPVGHCAYHLVAQHNCSKCRKQGQCLCMQEVTPEMIAEKLFEIFP
jgi:ADP-heptose:LPS heptosyltransferase